MNDKQELIDTLNRRLNIEKERLETARAMIAPGINPCRETEDFQYQLGRVHGLILAIKLI